MVGRDVNGVCGRVMAHRQPKVGDTACAILLHQDILGLQVTVGNGRLTWVDSSKRHKGIVSPLRTDWVCASLWSTNLMQTSLFFTSLSGLESTLGELLLFLNVLYKK